METSRSSGLTPGQWAIRRATEGSANAEDLRARMERLRREVATQRPGAADWEASVLDNLASLLESMDHARVGWESMAAELSDAHEHLRAADHERTRLEEAEARLERVQEELTIARQERDDLDEANRRLRETAAEAEDLRRELDAARAGLEAHRREREAQEPMAREIAALRERLETARRERDLLAEERNAHTPLRSELLAARERIAALEKEAEQDLVLVCDLRARVNRLEEERDDTARKAREKVKRILAHIHEELDRIGAPKGEEMSFGERIRRLREP